MARINIRDIYPDTKRDCYIDVPDSDAEAFTAAMTREIADVYLAFQRENHAYYERRRYHKAYFSLSTGSEIESEAVDRAPSAEEVVMEKLTRDEIHAALATLPDPQRGRVEAHYIHGMTYQAIADAEGVNESAVRASVKRALAVMRKSLKNSF